VLSWNAFENEKSSAKVKNYCKGAWKNLNLAIDLLEDKTEDNILLTQAPDESSEDDGNDSLDEHTPATGKGSVARSILMSRIYLLKMCHITRRRKIWMWWLKVLQLSWLQTRMTHLLQK
jgi:hypothetical protein